MRTTSCGGSRVRRGGAAGRTLVVLFLCAGIALLGLLSGGEHQPATARHGSDPMVGYYPPEMPRYPHAVELPAGPATRVGAAQLRMSFFTTQDDPARVAGFYDRFWRSRKLWVRSDVTHLGGVVSAVDEKGGQIYQVLIVSRDGSTSVFPSVTRAPQSAGDTGRTRSPVALIDKSRVLFALTTRDNEATARIVLSVNAAGMEANLQHYRQALAAAGYRPGQAAGEPAAAAVDRADRADRREWAPGDYRVLLYTSAGGEEVTVNLTALGGDRVRVHIVAVGT